MGVHLAWMICNLNQHFKVEYSTLLVIDAVLGVCLPFLLLLAMGLTDYNLKLQAEESFHN